MNDIILTTYYREINVILIWISNKLFYIEVELHKYIVTLKLQLRVDNLPYNCGI